jgi:hypothetical protein
MFIKAVLVAALVVSSATLATADSFDPLINHETAPTITVSQRPTQLAPVRLQDRTQQGNDAWMQLNRRVPGNSGDTSYGRDWGLTWGD